MVAEFVGLFLGGIRNGAVRSDYADVDWFALEGGPKLEVAVDHGGAAAFGLFVVVDFVAFVFEVGFGDFGGFAVEFLGVV